MMSLSEYNKDAMQTCIIYTDVGNIIYTLDKDGKKYYNNASLVITDKIYNDIFNTKKCACFPLVLRKIIYELFSLSPEKNASTEQYIKIPLQVSEVINIDKKKELNFSIDTDKKSNFSKKILETKTYKDFTKDIKENSYTVANCNFGDSQTIRASDCQSISIGEFDLKSMKKKDKIFLNGVTKNCITGENKFIYNNKLYNDTDCEIMYTPLGEIYIKKIEIKKNSCTEYKLVKTVYYDDIKEKEDKIKDSMEKYNIIINKFVEKQNSNHNSLEDLNTFKKKIEEFCAKCKADKIFDNIDVDKTKFGENAKYTNANTIVSDADEGRQTQYLRATNGKFYKKITTSDDIIIAQSLENDKKYVTLTKCQNEKEKSQQIQGEEEENNNNTVDYYEISEIEKNGLYVPPNDDNGNKAKMYYNDKVISIQANNNVIHDGDDNIEEQNNNAYNRKKEKEILGNINNGHAYPNMEIEYINGTIVTNSDEKCAIKKGTETKICDEKDFYQEVTNIDSEERLKQLGFSLDDITFAKISR